MNAELSDAHIQAHTDTCTQVMVKIQAEHFPLKSPLLYCFMCLGCLNMKSGFNCLGVILLLCSSLNGLCNVHSNVVSKWD